MRLWARCTPFDAKGSWGGMPLVPKTKINTTDSTAPTYLGLPGNLIDNPGAERFFDLSGWKDAAGMAEPTVTAGSKNTTLTATPLRRCTTAPDAEGQQVPYHAELFEQCTAQAVAVRRHAGPRQGAR